MRAQPRASASRPRHARRTDRPTALSLLLGLVLAASASGPAEAIKLWEREKTRQPASAPETAAKGPRAMATRTTGPAGAATALGVDPAWTGAPALESFASRRDHRRVLEPLAAAVARRAGTDGELAARLVYGNALAERGYVAEAGAEYLAALEIDADEPAAWINLGALLRRTGQLDLATGALLRAVDLAPRHGLAWYQLGMTHHAARDLPKADEAYVRALSLDPRLWHPDVNPHVLVNDRASLALHALYRERSVEQAPWASP